MTEHYRRLTLSSRPIGAVKPSDFEVIEAPLPELQEGEVQVRITHLSLDPAMRGWMNDAPSYIPPVALGEVMRAGGLGRVEASKNERFQPGDIVSGLLGVQEVATIDGKQLRTINPDLAPLTTNLGVIGMTGLTAYFGLLEVGAPKAGDTVLVSGAAGATGSVVGQIAKLKGCRVVGIAGGAEKCSYLTDILGFDAAVDYKDPEGGDIRRAIAKACPEGIDVYFDNVGGEILDAALLRINQRARVVICGAISLYNAASAQELKGPANYLTLLVKRARMEGFIVFDYFTRYPEAIHDLAGWLAEGKLHHEETIVEGDISDFPETLQRLFSGKKRGKLILNIA